MNNESFKNSVKYAYVKIRPNQQILIEGKMHSTLYLIKSGALRVVVNSESTEFPIIAPGIAHLGPGEIVGEFTFIDNSPASADVFADTESELIEIDIHTFRKFLDNNPNIGYQFFFELLKVFVNRYRRTNKTILNLLEWGIKMEQNSR
jgi:CRP-like cAMP-binding protein